MLFSSFICGAVLLAASCLAAPTKLGLEFNKRGSALPTLTLPYGTWQASSYDANGDVCSQCTSFHAIDRLKPAKDIYVQEYPFWSSSGWQSEMGQACTACAGDDRPGWILWACLCSGAYQGPSAYGSWRQLAHWNGPESVSWRHTGPVFYCCI